MSILPNPAKDIMRICIAAPMAVVTITDAAGRTLRTLPAVNGEATFLRGGLPAGMYYVRAVAENNIAFKIIVIMD